MKKEFIYFLIFLSAASEVLLAQEDQNFIFGVKKNTKEKGAIVESPIKFSEEKTYGFDFGTSKKAKINAKDFTANESVYFSTIVPEGNYKIEVVLGSSTKSSETTIKAESKRIMQDRIKVDKGQSKTEEFIVNVRKPHIGNGENVSLKDREINDLDWDNKLTLEFSGDVAVQKICISSANNVKTVYLAGDSTMTDQDLEPWTSWGQTITQYFNNDIAIANHAFSGAAQASFKGRRRLEKIKNLLQPGDYLVIGFAHNDEKRKGEGIGPWQSYTDLLKEFVMAAKEKKANPILITPTQRRSFNNDGSLNPTHGDYPAAIRKVAEEMNVPLIDITKMTTSMYESWGDKISRKAFVQYPANTFPGQDKKLEDNTHFNGFGANEIALAFIHGIKEQNLPLAKYLNRNVPDYDPEHPNELSSWQVPLSPRFENVKPDGN